MNMKGNVCYIAFAPEYGAGGGYSKKYDAYKFRPSLLVVIDSSGCAYFKWQIYFEAQYDNAYE